ncbi:MAG TPA: dipeptide ABC transporter ATP-binding protein [Acidimicrobiales bacterium]|nr:dipeptide ABC transporter ATP-binding protein [Acidimicrobiales bacterium]
MNAAATLTATSLLEVADLRKHFPVKRGLLARTVGEVRAVDGVSFTLDYGETLALVGESGCGKTTTGRLVLGLEEPTEGVVRFQGTDLAELDAKSRRATRRHLQLVFQDPFGSLDPRMTAGQAVLEGLVVNGLAPRATRAARARELLERVGLSASDVSKFPHQFSGGQRQRIGIARALATDPSVVVCDEPVSALDVSVQAQILNLLRDLQEQSRVSYLFISHDLNVVRYISDRIAVMYLGEIVETAPKTEFFAEPLHPYSKALMSAIPTAVPGARRERIVLQGEPPSPASPPPGCRFHTRCPWVMDVCRDVAPEPVEVAKGRTVACHLYGGA